MVSDTTFMSRLSFWVPVTMLVLPLVVLGDTGGSVDVMRGNWAAPGALTRD